MRGVVEENNQSKSSKKNANEFYLSQTEDYSLEACFPDDYEKQFSAQSYILSEQRTLKVRGTFFKVSK